LIVGIAVFCGLYLSIQRIAQEVTETPKDVQEIYAKYKKIEPFTAVDTYLILQKDGTFKVENAHQYPLSPTIEASGNFNIEGNKIIFKVLESSYLWKGATEKVEGEIKGNRLEVQQNDSGLVLHGIWEKT